MTIKEIPAFFPADFFEVKLTAFKGKNLELPDFSAHLGEQSFAKCLFTYSLEGLELSFDIRSPFVDCFYPAFTKGDCVEVMIDTRAIKTGSVMHKYGHHFVVLPKEVDGIRALELTKFHGEDKHPLADPASIQVQANFSSRGYKLSLFFGEGSLFGFSPDECPKIGFAYRIHRTAGEPMHFTVSSKYFKIERAPALWATIELT